MGNGTLGGSTDDAFRARPLLQGADEVLERRWAPDQVVEEHAHPFDADAVVSAGEMWLTRAGVTEHLKPGDTFRLPAGTPHSERYGPQGDLHWSGGRFRCHRSAPAADRRSAPVHRHKATGQRMRIPRLSCIFHP